MILAGHYHRFHRINPGEGKGNQFPILVLGQKQIAHLKVSEDAITVDVRDQDNKIVDSFQTNRKGEVKSLL